MAAKKSEIVVREEEMLMERPSFIPVSHKGFELMRPGDIELPRISVVQKQSKSIDEFEHKQGQLVQAMTGEVLAQPEEELLFTPLFFYPEWLRWGNPDDGGGLKGRSLDPNSELAAKCAVLGMDPDTDGSKIVEYLNFVVCLKGRSPDEVFNLGFFKTSYKYGKRLLNLCQWRKADMFAGVYAAYTYKDTNPAKQDYQTIRVKNMGWVQDPALLKAYSDQHAVIHKAYTEDKLVTQQEAGEPDGPSKPVDSKNADAGGEY